MNTGNPEHKHAQEEQELRQRHTQEEQVLRQKYEAERTSLERQIQNIHREIASSTLKLHQRSLEQELARLQHELDAVPKKYLDLYRSMQTRQAVEYRFMQTRQAVEPMVISMLNEVAIKKSFTRKKTKQVVRKFWLFLKRQVTEEIEYPTNPEARDFTDQVVEVSPGVWSIEGKMRVGCTVIYTVRLNTEQNQFEVSAKSNASYSASVSREPTREEKENAVYEHSYDNDKDRGHKWKTTYSWSKPITRDTMKVATSTTRDLTENGLLDALLHVMDNVYEGPACHITYQHTETDCYDCLWACGDCSGCVYPRLSMPSLTSVSSDKLLSQIGHPSRYLQTVQGEDTVLVYHALLGSLHYAEPEILDFLSLADERSKSGSPLPLDELHTRFPDVINLEDDIARMRRLGMLVANGEDEEVLQQAQRQHLAYQRGELVRALRLNLTTSCNLACSYCHGINDGEQDELVTCFTPAPGDTTRMPLEIAREALRVYTNLLREHGQQVMQVRCFGGEPLLNWTVLRDSLHFAADLAQQHGLELMVHLNTNGLLLTPDIVQALLPYRDSARVIVSLDGVGDAHNGARHFRNGGGSFDGVWQGVERLQAADMPFTISATLGTHNLMHLHEFIDFLLSKGIHGLGIDPVRIVSIEQDPTAIADVMIDAMEYGYERGFSISGLWAGIGQRVEEGATGAFCGGSGSELSVMPTGEIYPCQAQTMRLGTLADVESRALFETEAYRQVVLRVAGNIPACRGCEIEGMCGGGCGADALTFEHNLYGRTRYCEFIRRIVRHHLNQLLESVSQV
jgi:radical SAM protein with 4Fe4S-binding SPASM domain